MQEHKELVIKSKGNDGYKTFSVRIPEDVVRRIEDLSARSGNSRNALIIELLKYGLDNCKIESD